jgi:hypothetical protein
MAAHLGGDAGSPRAPTTIVGDIDGGPQAPVGVWSPSKIRKVCCKVVWAS